MGSRRESANDDVARTIVAARGLNDTADDYGVRKIENNGKNFNGPDEILSGHL